MKKILTAITLGLAVAGTLSACSSGPSAEDEFVSVVRESLDTGYSDSELLGIARDACDAVAAGGGQQALQQLAMESGMTVYDYGVVVGVASTSICPEQEEALKALFNNG